MPRQVSLPWRITCRIAWFGVRRRLSRSLVAVSCVVLAIAFVTHMLVTDDIVGALVDAHEVGLDLILQQNGVDIFAVSHTDAMTYLLIALSLLTCTVGIVNTMLMAVAERVKEIGTLKCLGARDVFIVQTYFVESTMQGLCGAVAGLVLGGVIAVLAAAAEYGPAVFRLFPAGPAFVSLLESFGCGVVIAVVASVAPAYAAARKQPVDALRVEE